MANTEADMVLGTKVSRKNWADPRKKASGIKRYFWTSALARRIIAFNLIALFVLLLGMMYLSQFRNNTATEQLALLEEESTLYAFLLQERILADRTATSPSDALLGSMYEALPTSGASEVRIFDLDNKLLMTLASNVDFGPQSQSGDDKNSFFYVLDNLTGKVASLFKSSSQPSLVKSTDDIAQSLARLVKLGGPQDIKGVTQAGKAVVASGQPITVNGVIIGSVIASTPEGLMDALRTQERNNILYLFALAATLSILLSLVLANTIASPIHDLAAAMVAGTGSKRDKNNSKRILIPDMTGRDDEIGHLSSAMHNMTSALYHRVETNEQFAADVAHEIKNPLASLRSAIETLRIAPDGEKRNKLLDVVEHDIRRLDRLVSDISNASRLDADLVKEEEKRFDLTEMLNQIVDFHSLDAKDRGIEMIFDKPDEKIFVEGLEERLAQVFVNLIINAVSFCKPGGTVRLWARHVENRVLIVVEDTGRGIPADSLDKVFTRFYSNRPEENFGDNSGLGLSISKQIVESHGGVIWAENIYVKDAPEGSSPLGARFVVGLPG